MDSNDRQKEAAAKEAVKLVRPEMIVGLGSGSTSAHAVRLIGKMVAEGLNITGIPTSAETERLARDCGIPLKQLNEITSIDLTLDGADEFDPYFQLIKGGGGALLREKIVASVTKYNVIMVDKKKEVSRLGQFKLPIEVIPFALQAVMNRLTVEYTLRKKREEPYITDEQNNILDLDIWPVTNLADLNTRLIQIPGVVETGLFLDYTDLIIVGQEDGTVVRYERH